MRRSRGRWQRPSRASDEVAKKDRSVLIALVLQVAALACLVLLYLYLRGLATREPAMPVIPLPPGGPEESAPDRGPQGPRTGSDEGAHLGRI